MTALKLLRDNFSYKDCSIIKPIMGYYRPPDIFKFLNHDERPADIEVDTVVIHYTVVDYHKSYSILTAERGVSAHFLIREDGRIDNLVDITKKAWHAGVSYWNGKESVNNFSIGIELVNPGHRDNGEEECFPLDKPLKSTYCNRSSFPEAQMEALDRLLNYIKCEFPNLKEANIIGHEDITAFSRRKIDPGIDFDWQWLAKNGHGLYSDIVISSPKILFRTDDQSEEVKHVQYNLKKLGYNITVNGNFDEQTTNIIWAFKLHYDQNSEYAPNIWDEQANSRLENLIGQIEPNSQCYSDEVIV